MTKQIQDTDKPAPRIVAGKDGWSHCLDCDEYLSPAQAARHVMPDGTCRPQPARRRRAMTLGEAAWGPGGCYEPD